MFCLKLPTRPPLQLLFKTSHCLVKNKSVGSGPYREFVNMLCEPWLFYCTAYWLFTYFLRKVKHSKSQSIDLLGIFWKLVLKVDVLSVCSVGPIVVSPLSRRHLHHDWSRVGSQQIFYYNIKPLMGRKLLISNRLTNRTTVHIFPKIGGTAQCLHNWCLHFLFNFLLFSRSLLFFVLLKKLIIRFQFWLYLTFPSYKY